MNIVPKTWAYGVTTVPQRRVTLLPRTLASLRAAGFDCPRLFVDGCDDPSSYSHFGLELTMRYPSLRAYGNWLMALLELYLRSPNADRFAVFQDDFVTYRNLRAYLDWCPYPGELNDRPKGYWNLYTFPENQRLSDGKIGWFFSNQLGKGGVALVFNREATVILLEHQHMITRAQDVNRGWKALDGGVVDSMRKSGWKEYVHDPSLVQHTGMESTISRSRHALAPSFRGEEFNAEEMIP